MGDRVVQIAGESFAFEQLDLVELADSCPGPVPERLTEGDRREQHGEPADRVARAGVPGGSGDRRPSPAGSRNRSMQSRRDPHRNSEYGRISTNAIVLSCAALPVSSAVRLVAATTMTTISSGLVRRHNSVGTSPATTTTQATRDGRSGRSRPSSTVSGTSTPTSTQSRHARGGGVKGRGSSQAERRRSNTRSS